MQPLLVGIVGFAALLYLVMPIVIKFNQKLNAHPQFQPLDLATLPPPAYEYLWACQQALEAEGFETIAHVSWANSAPNVFPFVSLYMNRATETKALASAFYVAAPDGVKMTTRYVEFITRYASGTVLGTNNNRPPGAFRHGPEQQTLRLPEMQNPHALYAVHRERTARLAGTPLEPLPRPGTEVAVQQERIVEDYNEQVKFGLLYLDHKRGVYRPTWQGAYLMTWSQLQPMKFLREARERRKSRAALQALEASPLRGQV